MNSRLFPLNGEFVSDAAAEEFDFGDSETEWESEFRWPGVRRGYVARTPRSTPQRPQTSPLRRKRRWPRRLVSGPYGVAPEPYPVEVPGSEHVRWAQSALNHVLGLRLPVQGVMDAATRSAIRSFQQRKGLPADGVLGPETERALSAAQRARTAPGGAQPMEPARPLATEKAEGELSGRGRSCGCRSCQHGEPRSSQFVSNTRIQPEAFEFEPESLFGEFETEVAELTDPLPYGCIDVNGRCINVGCAPPYKCVRRFGVCKCKPGYLCPAARDPKSGRCLKVLRRDGNYLVCCPKGVYRADDPCCVVYPLPSRPQEPARGGTL